MTQITQPVGITTVTSKDIEDLDKEAEKRRAIKTGIINGTDSVEIHTSTDVMAKPGETQSPKANKGTAGKVGSHEGLVAAKSTVEQLLREAGVNPSPKDLEKAETLEAVVVQTLENLDGEMDEGDGKSPVGFKRDKLLQLREKLAKALEEYRTQYTSTTSLQGDEEVDVDPLNHDAVSAQTASVVTPEEAKIWKTLGVNIEKTFGIKIGKEKNPEKIQTELFQKFKEALKTLNTRESELKAKAVELKTEMEKAQKTKEPEAVQKLTKQAQILVKELKEIGQQKALLQKDFATNHALIEQVSKFQIERELGLSKAPVAVQSASVSEESTSSPTLLGSQSVGEEEADSSQPTAISSQHAAHRSSPGAATLQVASAGEGTPESVSLDTASASAPLLSDQSGVFLSIASQNFSLKADAKKTDQQIKKLLAAVLSGNSNAIMTCLILLDKKSSMNVIKMGAQTIKAMQYYEKQMGILSNSMGKMDAKSDPNYSSKLAQINSQMNMYSLNRQAISGLLKETLTAREESVGLVTGLQRTFSQITNKAT